MIARLFIAIPIPDHVAGALEQALSHYPQYIEMVTPVGNWHLTLLFLGEVKNYSWYRRRLTKDLPQPYLPVITVTHVGRGLHRGQLWAYAHETNVLKNVRAQICRRVSKLHMPMVRAAKQQKEKFVPHVRLATLRPATCGIGLADYPVGMTFTVRQAVIWRSELLPNGARYTSEGTINFVP